MILSYCPGCNTPESLRNSSSVRILDIERLTEAASGMLTGVRLDFKC